LTELKSYLQINRTAGKAKSTAMWFNKQFVGSSGIEMAGHEGLKS
jgi:hypothetical protein